MLLLLVVKRMERGGRYVGHEGEENVRTWMETRGKGEYKEAKVERIDKRMIRRMRGLREGKY
jgi:hypothetical protein